MQLHASKDAKRASETICAKSKPYTPRRLSRAGFTEVAENATENNGPKNESEKGDSTGASEKTGTNLNPTVPRPMSNAGYMKNCERSSK